MVIAIIKAFPILVHPKKTIVRYQDHLRKSRFYHDFQKIKTDHYPYRSGQLMKILNYIQQLPYIVNEWLSLLALIANPSILTLIFE